MTWTGAGVNNLYPTISPNGQQIAFVSNRSDADGNSVGSQYDVWGMHSDGTGLKRLSESGGIGRISWSSFDNRIATATEDREILAGLGELAVNLTQNAANDDYPNWSGTDGILLFTSNRATGTGNEIYKLFRESAPTAEQLTSTSGEVEHLWPAWSPTGDLISFIQRDLASGDTDLWVMGADGSSAYNASQTSGKNEWLAAWSPDGTSLAVSQGPESGPQTIARYAIGSQTFGQTLLTLRNPVQGLVWGILAPPQPVIPVGLE